MNVNKINDELHVEYLKHKYSYYGGREGKCHHIKNNRLINNCHYNPLSRVTFETNVKFVYLWRMFLENVNVCLYLNLPGEQCKSNRV